MRTGSILSKMEEHFRDNLCASPKPTPPPAPTVATTPETPLKESVVRDENNDGSLSELFVEKGLALGLMATPKTEHPPGFDNFSNVSSIDQKSFDDTIFDVTNTLERSFTETMREISPTCVSKFQGGLLGSKDEWEDTDCEIQNVIEEIREQASRMDLVMALDQVKTLEVELKVVGNALEDRNSDAERLELQVLEMQERVACLELERDLHKADAGKLREDLKTCVERMFDITCVTGEDTAESDTSPKLKSNSKIAPTKEQCNIVRRLYESPPNSTFPVIAASRPVQSLTKSRKQHQGGVPTEIQLFPENSASVFKRISSSSEPGVVLRDYAITRAHPVSRDRQSIFRKPSQRNSRPEASSCRSPGSQPRAVQQQIKQRRHNSFSAGDMIHNYRADRVDETTESRGCGGIFRRGRQRRASRAQDISEMKHQIDSLHAMMKKSLATSEKLRKRLAMISRYYEGIIRRLQEEAAELKAEKSKLKIDLDSRIATIDHQKRLTIINLESMLRQKDEEMARLRHLLSRTESF